jgi:SAM-dependent methyltransferase
MNIYDSTFYAVVRDGSRNSAKAIFRDLIPVVEPRTAVDVGCGVGMWLGVLADLGIDVVGIDGDYVDRSMLEIPADRFRPHDLTKPLPKLGPFDLVISMETAEHLPPERAASFVADLCGLGSVVLFSAAIPSQGGTFHINEQWQEYWVELFRRQGFRAIDCVRPKVWNDPSVDWWYCQNSFLAVREDVLKVNENLRALAEKHSEPISLVHPRNYLGKEVGAKFQMDVRNHPLSQVLPALPSMLWNYVLGRRKTKQEDR